MEFDDFDTQVQIDEFDDDDYDDDYGYEDLRMIGVIGFDD